MIHANKKERVSKAVRAKLKDKRKARAKTSRARQKAWKKDKRSKRKSDKKFRRTDVSKSWDAEKKTNKKVTKGVSVFATDEMRRKAGWRNDAAKAAMTAYRAKEAKRKGLT